MYQGSLGRNVNYCPPLMQVTTVISNDLMTLKARSHGAFFFCAFAMRKMDYVGVNEGVHMVQFQVRVMHWCV